MKHTLLRLFTLLFIISATVSCNKDEPELDYKKLLTSHNWVEANTKFDTNDPYLLERMEMYKVLLESAEIQFSENGTFQGDLGSGSWELSSDNKTILFDQKAHKEEWSIHELGQSSLKVSFTRAFVDLENQAYNVKIYLDLVPKR